MLPQRCSDGLLADVPFLSLTVRATAICLEMMHATSETASAPAAPENVFRAIFDGAYQFMGLLDPDGALLEVNRTALVFGGVTREEVVGKPLWETLWWPEGERSGVRQAVAEAAGGKAVRYEAEVIGQRGPVSIDFSLRPLSDEAGRVRHLIAEGHDISERKSAERELLREREFMRAVLENIADGIAACDAEGLLTLFNPAARTLHGLPAQPLPASEWARRYDLYAADGRTPLPTDQIPLFRALQGELVQNAEIVVVPNQGTPKRLLANGRALTGAQGEHLGAVVAMRDVTAERAAEIALRESEAHFATMFYANPLPAALIDLADGRLLDLNARAEAALGFSRQEALGRTTTELGVRAARPLADPDEVARALREENGVQSVEVRFHHKDGALREALASLQNLTREGKPCTLITFMDITERKELEAQLRESEARYRAVVDTLSEGVVQQARDGSISTCNGAAERILGLTQDQMTGRSSLDPRWRAVHEDGSPYPGETHPAMVALRTGEAQQNKVMGVHKPDGSLTWMLVNSRPLLREGAVPHAVVSSFADITDLKHAEAQLRHSALHDPLTGLPTRRLLSDRLEQALSRRERSSRFHFALLFIDLDGFKRVNDVLGHGAGDDLLVEVARRLRSCVREGDTVARLGGDEFVILFEGITVADDATTLAGRVVRELNISVQAGSATLAVGASVGVSLPRAELSAASLLNEADAAMYRAKQAGKARYVVAEPGREERGG